MGKTILLIEDNLDDERLTRRVLQKNNVMNEVVVACDGQEAVEKLFAATAGDRVVPDLIILDLNLPKISGLEVLRRIRADAILRHTPVVVLTAGAPGSQAQECYEAGANSFIVKPVDHGEFAEAIETMALYWLLLNVPSPTVGVPTA